MPTKKIDSNIIKQILLLLIIIFMGIVIIWKLAYFIPGALGAITLYIILRNWYFHLIERKKWRRWIAATLMIIGLIIALFLPIYGLVAILTPMINDLISNSDSIVANVTKTIDYINQQFPDLNFSKEKVVPYLQQGLVVVPAILQSTASVFANIFTALFILYFLLMKGREIESLISRNLPFYQTSKNELWEETRVLVISNALGIPFLALCQGIVAYIGYLIFDIPNALIWALLTGVATILPVVGTMVVWVPICIFLLSNGQVGSTVGLAIYCLVAVGGIDNVLRMLFVKKFGDVHPLITIFGVILGLEIFGLMGLIFGPLLFSYIILLMKIYKKEFITHPKSQIIHHHEINDTDKNDSSSDNNIIL